MSYCIRKVWCRTFAQHTSFYLTSYVTDMNYITHRRFFVYLYQPIHWYLTRILTFLSEQGAPFSTMFASRAFHNVIWSEHSNVQVSIFVTCLNFAGTGSRLWQLYVAFVMTWYLAFKTSGCTAVWPVISGNQTQTWTWTRDSYKYGFSQCDVIVVYTTARQDHISNHRGRHLLPKNWGLILKFTLPKFQR